MSQAITLYTTPVFIFTLDRLRLMVEQTHKSGSKIGVALQPTTFLQ